MNWESKPLSRKELRESLSSKLGNGKTLVNY